MKKYILLSLLVFLSCKDSSKQQPKSNVNAPKLALNKVIQTIADRSKNNILVCAHRSYHKNAPENSLQSIKNAITLGVDLVELDVRTTKDSVLVLMHDDSIGRVSTGRGKVKDFTFKELQDFSLKIGDSVTSHKIPRLSDALKAANGKVIPNLDLKALDYNQLYIMLQKLQMEHEVISFIGDKEKVMEMISLDSLYAVMPLSKDKKDIFFYEKSTKSSLQHFTEDSFTVENMELAHQSDQLVFMNTLWDEDDDFIKGDYKSVDNVIALKPAIIQTDHPKILIDYLRSKDLHQ